MEMLAIFLARSCNAEQSFDVFFVDGMNRLLNKKDELSLSWNALPLCFSYLCQINFTKLHKMQMFFKVS